jgi:DNA-directed RNA polymerase subunit RPC12/RpoP
VSARRKKKRREPPRDKLKYTCAACTQRFETPHDQMMHYTAVHDGEYRRGAAKKLKRSLFCARCAGEMPHDGTGVWRCACGFTREAPPGS